MLERIVIPVVLYRILRTGAIGGTPHAGLPEFTRYFLVATGADGGIHILRRDYSGGKQAGYQKSDGLPHFSTSAAKPFA